MGDIEIEEHRDGTCDVWGDRPTRITFVEPESVVSGDGQSFFANKMSVRVYWGFDLTGCSYVVDNGTGSFEVGSVDHAELDDVVIEPDNSL